VTIGREGPDGRVVPHGISVLEIEDNRIVGIEAFPDSALVSRFSGGRAGDS
jgi:hypothetical protein